MATRSEYKRYDKNIASSIKELSSEIKKYTYFFKRRDVSSIPGIFSSGDLKKAFSDFVETIEKEHREEKKCRITIVHEVGWRVPVYYRKSMIDMMNMTELMPKILIGDSEWYPIPPTTIISFWNKYISVKKLRSSGKIRPDKFITMLLGEDYPDGIKHEMFMKILFRSIIRVDSKILKCMFIPEEIKEFNKKYARDIKTL